MTEQDLIEGLIGQRKDAVQYLVQTYQEDVIKTAFHFLGNIEDAEDLSQEVFLEIFRSIGRYKKEASLYTWIYRITVNRSLDQLRRQKRRAVFQRLGSLFQDHGDDRHPNGREPMTRDTTNDDMERRKILDTAVGSLPENQRIAFILSKYEELSYKQISEIMNLSLSSVESLIHRAKINLQNKLVRYFSEYAGNIR
jgi:RNA polymerase sigma factor (sigma-70 family)